MSRRFVLFALMVLVLGAMLAGTALAQAPATKQVGLVIAFPDGTKHIEIVTAPAAATSHDLLQAAKIALASTDGGFGPAVCSINNVGCPVTNCFCDAAHFWAFYHLDTKTVQWAGATTGVGGYVPANGEVEGFAWSGFDANFNPTVQPPVYTFAQILAETTPQPVPVPEPSTLLLLGGGLTGLAAYVRARKSR